MENNFCKNCTGCAACANVCPVGAIEMRTNAEGFLYPFINQDKCINCGLCARTCPVLNKKNTNNPKPTCYIGMAKNTVREKSSSGGIFGVLAEYILKNGGLVCGAAWNTENRCVEHIIIQSIDDLEKLQSSKYIQSDTKRVYSEIKQALKEGKTVLFTGTPCQNAAIRAVCGDNENLYCVDIICHGTPSPKVFRKYLDELNLDGNFVKTDFRDKVNGWKSALTITTKTTTETFSCPADKDDYTYNTQNGKESVYQCQTHCYAGTYVATAASEETACIDVGNGYFAGEATIDWGDVGMRTRCQNGGVTNMTNAGSADACVPVGTCSGATYMNSGTCEACPAGYTANTVNGKTAATDCQMVCPVGSYLATANATTCTDAGAGFWATGGAVNYGSTSTRTQCATGLTTVGYGHGADEASDCGHKLHLGDFILYTKTTKPTVPAINIQVENDATTHYIGVSDTDQTLTPIHVTQGNTQYTAFDDSILHGERDLETNTRITQ